MHNTSPCTISGGAYECHTNELKINGLLVITYYSLQNNNKISNM